MTPRAVRERTQKETTAMDITNVHKREQAEWRATIIAGVVLIVILGI